MFLRVKLWRFIVTIHQDYLDQIEMDNQNGIYHHIELIGMGRHAPINLVVFQVFDEDEILYFGVEIESWAFDSDGGDDFDFEDIKDNIQQIELVEIKEMKWRFVK